MTGAGDFSLRKIDSNGNVTLACLVVDLEIQDFRREPGHRGKGIINRFVTAEVIAKHMRTKDTMCTIVCMVLLIALTLLLPSV